MTIFVNKYLRDEWNDVSINKAVVVLIPNPRSMKDFRPISLCNVLYKIASKALANHLKLMLA